MGRDRGRERGGRSIGRTGLVQLDGLSIAGLRGVHSPMWGYFMKDKVLFCIRNVFLVSK